MYLCYHLILKTLVKQLSFAYRKNIYPLVSLSCVFFTSMRSAIPPALIVDISPTKIELSKLSSSFKKKQIIPLIIPITTF